MQSMGSAILIFRVQQAWARFQKNMGFACGNNTYFCALWASGKNVSSSPSCPCEGVPDEAIQKNNHGSVIAVSYGG
jgi:hypothetical protein